MKRLALLLLLVGCNKLNPLNNISQPTNDNDPPAVTGIGTPTGIAVSKPIGPSGGTITSADGRIGLDIPAGALAANTIITIQPVTNTCPGGLGLAYDLQPNGTKFSAPVTFTYHYTDAEVNGTDPYLFFEAVQDSLQQWDVDIYRDVDTVAHTVSFDISHFSTRSMLPGFQLKPDPDVTLQASKYDYYQGEQGVLRMMKNIRDGQLTDDDDLSTLPESEPVPLNLVSGWTVQGGAANGTIEPEGSEATYTAPASIDKDRQVVVSAFYKQELKIPSRKSKGHTVIQRLLTAYNVTLNLHPSNISFLVKVACDVTGFSNVYADQYHDECTFEVDVKGGVVTVPPDKIVNQAPTVTPTSGTGKGEKATWIPDPIGVINIISGSGIVTPTPDSSGYRVIALLFTSQGTVDPSYSITDANGFTYTVDPAPVPGVPIDLDFQLRDDPQTPVDPLSGTGSPVKITITVTPIH